MARATTPWARVETGPMGDRLYLCPGRGWDVLAPAYSTSLYLVGQRHGGLVQVEPEAFRRADLSRREADAAVRRFLEGASG